MGPSHSEGQIWFLAGHKVSDRTLEHQIESVKLDFLLADF
jgi:hypothetical protein